MTSSNTFGEDEINQMTGRLNLPPTITASAINLFKMLQDGKHSSRRWNTVAVTSACLYIACRQEGEPRTFKEIRAVTKISQKEFSKSFKFVREALDIIFEGGTVEPLVSRYCLSLGLPNTVQEVAECIGRSAISMLPGVKPSSVAATAIYMASQASSSELKKSHKEIEAATGVGVTTIRYHYKLLYRHAGELFPQDFTAIDKLPTA